MIDLATWAHKWRVPVEAMQELRILHATGDALTEPAFPERTEADVQQNIRIVASRYRFAMWRNNSGALKNEAGIPVRFGLGNVSARLNKKWKSADLIGIGPGGKFVAVECKEPGWSGPRTDEENAQMAMLTQVNALGGIGIFATSSNDYARLWT